MSRKPSETPIYENRRQGAAIVSVEFTPVRQGADAPGETLAYFHLSNPAQQAEVSQWLAAHGQRVIAATSIKGQPVLVALSGQSPEVVLQTLQARGEELVAHPPKRGSNTWKWRGELSLAGQALQLTSSIISQGGLDIPTATFATSNLLASTSNIVFGAEKKGDPHRLRFLKQEFNKRLGAQLPQGTELPNPDEKQYQEPPKKVSFGQGIYNFLQRNSVTLGEIGLRSFGSVNLIFPAARWKFGWQKLQQGQFVEAIKVTQNHRQLLRNAAIVNFAGQMIGLGSKTPDPYNPKQPSWLENIREKYLFNVSSLVSATAYSLIAFERYRNNRLKIGKGHYRDFVGAIGGAFVAVAFLVRLGAPFGVREVDMNELNAHMANALAKAPPEKLPQLIAETAAFVKEQLKDKPVEFSQIYAQILQDLDRQHHMGIEKASGGLPVAANTLQNQPEEPKPKLAAGIREHVQLAHTSTAQLQH